MTLTGLTPSRRAPGIVFETAPAPLGPSLPRLDIAGFVGFASAGPVDTPVVVEDAVRYREIFGPDQPLGFDEETGGVATANLGSAVEAFFANGGARAWVVRVAGDTTTNEMPVPGLLAGDPDRPDSLVLATVRSRSAGSWSDGHRAGAASQRLTLDGDGSVSELSADRATLTVSASVPLDPGDLVEIGFASGDRLLAEVATVRPGDDGHPAITLDRHRWVRQPAAATVAGATVALVTATGRRPVPATEVRTGTLGRMSIDLVVDGAGPGDSSLTPGDTVMVDDGDDRIVTVIHHLAMVDGRLTAEGFPTWTLPAEAPAADAVGVITGVTRIRLSLGHWTDDRLAAVVAGLACGRPSDRWWGHLPTDDDLFGRQGLVARTAISRATRERQGPIDDLVTTPRFGLAGPSAPGSALPIGLVEDHELTRTGPTVESPLDPLTRDGLDELRVEPFLDPGLRRADARSLGARIRQRMVDPDPGLTGLHALAPFGEISLLAVPDATTRPWTMVTTTMPPVLDAPRIQADGTGWSWSAVDGADRYRLETSVDHTFAGGTTTVETAERRLGADGAVLGRVFARVRAIAGDRVGPWSATADIRLPPTAVEPCHDPIPDAPILVSAPVDPDGDPDHGPERPVDGSLRWDGIPGAGYQLQRADNPDFVGARDTIVAVDEEATTGPGGTAEVVVEVPIDGGTGGTPARPTRWYRVRRRGEPPSPWSATVGLVGRPTSRWVMATSDPDDPIAREIHRAALALGAARGDLFAVLSLPRGMALDEADAHVDRLAERGEWGDRTRSHGAVYHPWIVTADDSDRGRVLVARPPDGAVVGMLARRGIERGAWVAPANETLDGGVGPDATLAPDGIDRWRSLVNPVVADRRGLRIDQADTLHLTGRQGDAAHPGTDRRRPGRARSSLRHISVRRLMILLNRLVRLEGDRHLFEPNDDHLRRMLRTDLETVLGDLFRRGAFAGARAEQAFRVITDRADDRSADRGTVVVELHVAPSRPLEFLTVRLVQEGGRSVAEEVA